MPTRRQGRSADSGSRSATKPVPAWLGESETNLLPRKRRWKRSSSLRRVVRRLLRRERAALRQFADAARPPAAGLLCPGSARSPSARPSKKRRSQATFIHTRRVILDATALESLVSHADLFDVKYWSLEQAKLGEGRCRGARATDCPRHRSGRGIGFATAEHFSSSAPTSWSRTPTKRRSPTPRRASQAIRKARRLSGRIRSPTNARWSEPR